MTRTSRHSLKFCNKSKIQDLDQMFALYESSLKTYLELIKRGQLPIKQFLSTKDCPECAIKHSRFKQLVYKNASEIVRSQLANLKQRVFNRYKRAFVYCLKNNKFKDFTEKHFHELNINYLKRLKFDLKNISIMLNENLFDIEQCNDGEFDEFVRIFLPIFKEGKKRAKTICLPKTTFIDHYGIDNNMKSRQGLKEYEDGIEKKYGKGIRNISQVKEIKQKKVETCNKNFGVDYPQQSPIIQKKTQAKCLQKYGYAKAIQSPEVKRKAKSKYFYDGIFFDSAPELAYCIWLTDNHYSFKYHPDVGFKYECRGQMYVYQPDFKVDEQFVEIKGDQFFKEDGTMQNPYDHSKDAIAEAKHQCMLKNGVKILRYKDYIMYVNYVKQTYGAQYLKSFKRTSEVNSKQDEECS